MILQLATGPCFYEHNTHSLIPYQARAETHRLRDVAKGKLDIVICLSVELTDRGASGETSIGEELRPSSQGTMTVVLSCLRYCVSDRWNGKLCKDLSRLMMYFATSWNTCIGDRV